MAKDRAKSTVLASSMSPEGGDCTRELKTHYPHPFLKVGGRGQWLQMTGV